MTKKGETQGIGFASAAPAKPKPKRKRRELKKNMPDRRRPPLEPRELKAIQGIVEGKSARRAAREAGYSQSMSDKANEKVFRGPVLDALNMELEAIGCTGNHLAQRIFEGTNAKMVKVATYEGKITHVREFVDMEQRGRYIDRALELKGHIKRGGAAVEVNLPVMLMHSIPRPQHPPITQGPLGNDK